MADVKEKKKWSKKKKIAVITLCVLLFLLAAAVCAGLGVLHWYCKTVEYDVVSSADIAKYDTKLIAHRGFRAVAPENTLPAYEEAGKADFWGAECDIYRTKDGVWVVQHDPITYRMMNVTKNIEKMTYEELLQYKTDNGNNIAKYPDLKICTLDEYLQACEKYTMNAVIELKGKNNTEHYDEIMESISKYTVDYTFISFQRENLEKLRELDETAPMFYLVQKIEDEDIEFAKSLGNCGIDFNGGKEENYENDAAVIKKCVEEELEVGAWTIDDIKTMQTLLDLGVNYITTDCITY